MEFVKMNVMWKNVNSISKTVKNLFLIKIYHIVNPTIKSVLIVYKELVVEIVLIKVSCIISIKMKDINLTTNKYVSNLKNQQKVVKWKKNTMMPVC